MTQWSKVGPNPGVNTGLGRGDPFKGWLELGVVVH